MTANSSLIDIMARAIANTGAVGDHWADLSPPDRDDYRREARAALRSLLEAGPTQRMLDEVCSDDAAALFAANDETMRAVFREMIAAELGGPTTMADHTPTDETILPGRNPVDVVAAVFDLEPAPAATVSAQEIAEMRARRDRVVRDVPQSEHGKAARFERMSHLVGSDMPRLLDAIEVLTASRTDALDTFRAIGLALGLPDPLAADAPADCPAEWNGKLSEKVAAVVAEREALTAKNQRLTDALNTTVQEATTAIDDRLKPEIERLTAENARLTSENTDIRTMIADPQMVHLGMLRGGIAKPSLRNMLHLNGGNALRIWDEAVETRIELAGVTAERDALKAEVERLTDKLGKYAMPPWEADACRREAMAARRALCLGEHNPNVAPADIYDRIVALRTANETRSEDVR